MSNTPQICALGLAAASLLPVPLTAQDVPATRLDRPAATFAEPMSQIRGLRELTDGRVVVTDMIETAVRLIDFRSGAMQEIGRQGDGPGEYGMPGELFAAGGDTTLMLDMLNRRFLVIPPTGAIADETMPIARGGGGGVSYITLPRGVDDRGRIYFDLSGIVAPGVDFALRGESPILRLDPAANRTDTIATMQFPPMPAPRSSGRGQNVTVRFGGGPRPYQGRDTWAVARDGRVAIVRHADYRVEWHRAGEAPVVGPPTQYAPVRVGRAEKEAWADRMTQGTMVMVQNGQRRTMQPPKPNIDEQEWPEYLPPFVGNARITPEGELWIQRSRPASATRELYDVFDGQGRLVRQVELAEGRRLVGFGRSVLYAIQTDEDDLQWLERYRR